MDERHEVYEEQRGATKELQGSYEYNESSGAATKDTRSVDERHEVYEEQRGCYERAAK